MNTFYNMCSFFVLYSNMGIGLPNIFIQYKWYFGLIEYLKWYIPVMTFMHKSQLKNALTATNSVCCNSLMWSWMIDTSRVCVERTMSQQICRKWEHTQGYPAEDCRRLKQHSETAGPTPHCDGKLNLHRKQTAMLEGSGPNSKVLAENPQAMLCEPEIWDFTGPVVSLNEHRLTLE